MKKLLLSLLCLVPLVLVAQTKPAATVPFELENDCIYLYCRVNATDSLKFLFDTGADGSVLSERATAKVPLKRTGTSVNVGSNGSNTVSQSKDNLISFGGITKSNVTLTLIPYDTDRFDGVFGTDLMQGYTIELDYHKKELRFYAPDTYQNDLSTYARLKLHFVAGYPTIRSTLVAKGRRYSGLFGLDTGADNVLTVAAPFVRRHGLTAKLPQIGAATSQGSDGSSYVTPIALVPEIRVGEKRFYRIPVELSQSTAGTDAGPDKAGYWGNRFLKRFNTVWDFKHEYLYLKPNKNLYTEL